jgi:hypothetical protein
MSEIINGGAKFQLEPLVTPKGVVQKKGKTINFGGAVFCREQVSSKRTVQKNGKTMYEVVLDNGCRLLYPKQNSSNKASIFTFPRMGYPSTKVNVLWVYNFDGAQMTGSEMNDSLQLHNCQKCIVDVRDGNKTEEIGISRGDIVSMSGENGQSFGNKVLTDYQDKVTDENVEIKGAGVYTQGKSDYRSIFDNSNNQETSSTPAPRL